MKQFTPRISLFVFAVLFAGIPLVAQQTSSLHIDQQQKEPDMKMYLIERNLPGASLLTTGDLKTISQKSCSVLKTMGSGIAWIHSYVAGDKIMCVYKAANEALLREHAKKGGFPADRITEIVNVISPATADN
jgi:hypothetical protein